MQNYVWFGRGLGFLMKSVKPDSDAKSVRLDNVRPELKAFLDYVAGKESGDPFVGRLKAAIAVAKKNREWS